MASLQYEEFMEVTVVLDGNGNIQLWYLPGALDDRHQDSINHTGKCGWKTNMVLFWEMVDLKGSIDLSPGWYQQGHGVSQLLKSGREQNGTWQWVDQMSKFHALLSRTLMVIHPHICATPYHTNVNGWQQWLDMLITVGNYPPLDFVVTTLNLWF
ncbi:hypothetical protein F5141DRAFT_1060139 [Pisolithus sp. B1]|nr:hypothetical protein F5141DRAFT_1060139 [Pisolithus sp. B1]